MPLCYTVRMASDLSTVIQIAGQAGEMLTGYFNSNGGSLHFKEDKSLVTEADLAADRLITQLLREQFPSDGILSEELHHQFPSGCNRIWVVDPLDGTTNFSIGLPIWGISIARVADGCPDLAVVFFPLQKELFTAERGRGALLNNKTLRISPPDRDRPAAFFSCCTRTHRDYHVTIRYKTRILGSACYSMCAVACGMALIAFEATPKLWDIAATWLIIQEAGGTVETLDNSEPFPLQGDLDYRCKNYPTLCAATPELLTYARQNIRRKDKTV